MNTKWRSSYQPLVPFTIVQILTYITAFSAIIFALLELFMQGLFEVNGPLYYLGLSWTGLSHAYLWQPVTYFFVKLLDEQSISLQWMLTLAFNLYVLWFIGTNLCENFGEKSYLKFYLLSGVFSGIFSVAFSPLFHLNVILSGQASIILALLTVWLMKNKESRLYLLHLIPLKTRSIILIGLFLFLIFNIENLNGIYFIYYVTSVLFGYLYGILVWNLRSPFQQLQSFESRLIQIKNHTLNGSSSDKNSSKVVNLKGETMTKDDLFMDRMLQKISDFGEESLTREERARMELIAKKRNKNSKS